MEGQDEGVAYVEESDITVVREGMLIMKDQGTLGSFCGGHPEVTGLEYKAMDGWIDSKDKLSKIFTFLLLRQLVNIHRIWNLPKRFRGFCVLDLSLYYPVRLTLT